LQSFTHLQIPICGTTIVHPINYIIASDILHKIQKCEAFPLHIHITHNILFLHITIDVNEIRSASPFSGEIKEEELVKTISFKLQYHKYPERTKRLPEISESLIKSKFI